MSKIYISTFKLCEYSKIVSFRHLEFSILEQIIHIKSIIIFPLEYLMFYR